MATLVFRDWVNATLRGNSELTAEVRESAVVEVRFDATVSVAVSAESKTQRVSAHQEGPSIRSAEEEAFAREQPVGPVNRALREKACVYLVAQGRHAVPGWVFAETKTRSCSDCREQGKVGCNACGSRGNIDCGNCRASGYVFCHACSGRGYRMETQPARDHNGQAYYREVQVNCYCGNGRLRCGTCNGHRQVQCSRCRGAGHVTCQPCQGRGRISDCTTKTYFARHEATVRFQQGDSEAVAFARRHWAELVRRMRPQVADFTLTANRADAAVWELSGTLRLEKQALGIGERRVKVIGSPPASGGVASAVLEIDPFLGDTLGVERWEVARGRGRLLLELASKRLVQEGISAWDSSGGKTAQRTEALDSKLIEQYGPALSPEQRATIATLIGKGFGQLRGERLRRSWLGFSLASILWGMGMVFALLIVMSTWPKPEPAVGRSIGLGMLGACGLWFAFGWFRARRSLSKLGKRLGLVEELNANQGSWGVVGFILSFAGFNGGMLVAIIAAMAMIAYTPWLNDGLREEMLGSKSFNDRLPARREAIVTERSPRMSRPSAQSRAIAEMRPGTQVEVIGAPIGEWTPIRQDGSFGWARLPDAQ